MPVQYSYTSTSLSACTVQLYLYSPQCLYITAIPLLPSVPVQYSYTSTSLSACTVQLYLYSPYGPYGLYRASVPVQYSYTSTSPMDRTACTEPQCLYSTAIPLLPLRAVQPVQSLSGCTRVTFTLSSEEYVHCLLPQKLETRGSRSNTCRLLSFGAY